MPGETGSAIAHPVEGWMDRFGPELRVHLARMLASDEDAEDVLQQVWIAAYRQPPDDDPGSNVRAWLYRVATNAALDSLSRDRRRQRKLGEWDPDVGMGETSPPPDAALGKLDEQARAKVRELCSRLPRKQREAVWRRWAEGEDYTSIARELETSVESARANVYHGLTRLRSELFDLWKEEFGS
ncbi:MAG: RNA polymerase sigma factor [Gemmatimonadota bacterium]